jgi:hypothetical protein
MMGASMGGSKARQAWALVKKFGIFRGYFRVKLKILDVSLGQN